MSEAPAGTVEVTRGAFLERMNQLNVHPRSEPDASYWEMPDRRLIGVSKPGWKKHPGETKHYYLVKETT